MNRSRSVSTYHHLREGHTDSGTWVVVAEATIVEDLGYATTGVHLRLERHTDKSREYVIGILPADTDGSPEIAAVRLPELIQALSNLYRDWQGATGA